MLKNDFTFIEDKVNKDPFIVVEELSEYKRLSNGEKSIIHWMRKGLISDKVDEEYEKDTHRKLILKEMSFHHESFDNVVSSTITDEKLDENYVGRGNDYTIWTRHRVYFPAIHDGVVWCTSVSRKPDDVSTLHVGGY